MVLAPLLQSVYKLEWITIVLALRLQKVYKTHGFLAALGVPDAHVYRIQWLESMYFYSEVLFHCEGFLLG